VFFFKTVKNPENLMEKKEQKGVRCLFKRKWLKMGENGRGFGCRVELFWW
jgi:hypothetical protein